MARRRKRGLGFYGFPNDAALRREALALADASLPSRQSINRQYGRAIGDVRGFTEALVDLLEGSAGRGARAYDESIGQMRGVNEAAAARLGALGPEFAGAGVAAGAAGDSALARMLAGRASAARFGAAQPGIAGARGALGVTGLVNARTEAHKERTEAMRSQFLQALQQVRQNALAMTMANAELIQGDRAFREQRRQFGQSQELDWFNAQTSRAGAAAAGREPDLNEDYQQITGDARSMAERFFSREIPNPKYNPNSPNPGAETIRKPVPYQEAFRRIMSATRADLRALGFNNREVKEMIRRALRAAGYKVPKRQKPAPPSFIKTGPGPSEH